MDDNSNSLETLESEDTNMVGAGQNYAPLPQQPYSSKSKRKYIWIAVGVGIVIVGSLFAIIPALKQEDKKPPTNIVINTQTLSAGTLEKIEKQSSGGEVNEQLTISSSTLFRNDLTVQGETSLTKNVQIGSNLDVAGNTTIGGNISVSGLFTATNLGVGTVTAQTIKINGDISISGHILPTGNQPTATISVAAAGGTISIDGTDIAGTVIINTGNNNPIAGQLATITYNSPFATNSRVQLTPVNAASAALDYYVSQGTQFFTIQTGTIPTSGTTYIFNYFVTQ